MRQITWYASAVDWQQACGPWSEIARHSPCRQWSWLHAWWQAFGGGKQLVVGAWHDDNGRLLAALPCFWERTQHEGRVLRLLGSGSVCSDFVGLLTRPGCEGEATSAFASALLGRDLNRSDGSRLRWDSLLWDGVADDDQVTLSLLTKLEAGGCRRREDGPLSTWRLPIAANFDEQIAPCGKSTRRKLRNLSRRWWENGQATLRSTETSADFERGLEILIDLHQRRRESLGEPGCFADSSFSRFFRQASAELFAQDIWEIHWVEVAGQPVAAHTGFWIGDVFYMYQSGSDPSREELEPGWLLNVGTVHKAIEEGWRGIDFMRGDERYKEMLRAVPTRCRRERVCHPAWDSRTRFAAYALAQDLRRWWNDRQTVPVS